MRMLLATLAFLILGAPVSAHSKPNMFPSQEACKAAFDSGNFSVYEPKHKGLKEKNPANDAAHVARELESDACVHVLTTAGKQWVIQPTGTMLRWHANSDGSLGQPYALDACGNPIYGRIAYLHTDGEVDTTQVEESMDGEETTNVNQTTDIHITLPPTPPVPPAPPVSKCGMPGVKFDPFTGPCEQATSKFPKCGDPGVRFDPVTGPCDAPAAVVAEKKGCRGWCKAGWFGAGLLVGMVGEHQLDGRGGRSGGGHVSVFNGPAY